MISSFTLRERVELARQDRLNREQMLALIEDLWRELELMRRHLQER